MRRLKFTLLLNIIIMPAIVTAQTVHPDIQAALDWQLPKNECKFKFKRSNVASGMDRKYKRAVKKYKKCVAGYVSSLADEQRKMMSVAAHGLTREQADVIMGHMGEIQAILQVPRSKPSAPPAEVPMDTTEFQQTRHH